MVANVRDQRSMSGPRGRINTCLARTAIASPQLPTRSSALGPSFAFYTAQRRRQDESLNHDKLVRLKA